MFGFMELIRAFKADKRVGRDCLAGAVLALGLYLVAIIGFCL